MAFAYLRRSRLVVVMALGVTAVLVHLAIVEVSRGRAAMVFGVQAPLAFSFVLGVALMHWSIYASLLLTFSLTLRPGREALITMFARKFHGAITSELIVYTRRVTIAWCCFFAGQLATSIALFLFAPLQMWSFFVNILDIPLVVAMYLAEYMVRIRCLRNPPRHSLSVILDMVSDARKPHREPAGSP